MRRAIIWSFHLLLLTVPFAFSAATDELFEFNKMILTYGFTVLILILWLLRMIREGRLILAHTRFDIFLGLFLLSQLVSTLLSIHPHTSIFGYYSRFHGGLLSTLSYTILYFAAVSNIKKDEVFSVIRTLLFAGIGSALYAFPEHFGLSPSCVLIAGQWSVDCWIQDVQTRVFGTFGQPNWLAAYLITLIPLMIWWIADQVRTVAGKKVASSDLLAFVWPGMGLLLLLFTTLYTGSRSGFAGLALAFVILGAGWPIVSRAFLKKHASKKLQEVRWILTFPILLIGSCFLFMLSGTPFTPSIGEFFQQRQASSAEIVQEIQTAESPAPTSGTVLENGGTDSGVIRQIVWKGAIDVWRRYPLFGSGVETFAYSYYRDRPTEHNYVSEWDFLYNKAHNEYLNFLATTGIFGLGSVLLLMAAFTFFSLRTWYSRNESAEISLLALALLAGYGALAVSNFLGFSTVAVALLFFLWPALLEITTKDPALTEISTNSAKKKQEELEITLDGKTMLSVIIGVVGLFLFSWVYGMRQNDIQLAYSKKLAANGQAVAAYQTLDALTRKAPRQAEYWEQQGQILAQLAVSASSLGDATTAANLTSEAVYALDAATQANPVHLNIWKSRARGFIWLGSIESTYLQEAIASLQRAHELAPTDPKILYNLALLYENVGEDEKADESYRQTLELRSIYEQARKSYAEFLTRTDRSQEALEQYRFIDEKLKPGEKLFEEEIKALEASISAEAK
jgi:putative inorganic carbon (HCO3(-)) transporter